MFTINLFLITCICITLFEICLVNFAFQHREYRKGRKERIRYGIYRWCSFFIVSKRLGTWLMLSYLCIKLIYLINAVGQIFLMQSFLGFNNSYTLFGMEVLDNIIRGRDWTTTMVFPRVAYCYVRVKQLGSVNAVSAQCILPVNMLNEKIYIFLWFWMILTAFITAFSIPVWFLRLVKEKNRKGFIKKFLKLNELITKDERSMVQKFTRQFLRHDGIFLLQMISLNAGDIITSEIVCQLWQIFKIKYKNRNFLGEADENDETQLTIKMTEGGQIMTNLIQRQPSAPPNLGTICEDNLSEKDKVLFE